MIRTDITLDQDRRTESNCVCLHIVQCRYIVDNKCEFQHSSFHGDSNGDARLVSKMRKNDTIILSVVRMTFVHRLTFNTKIEDTFTSCRVCIDQNSSVLTTDSCPTNPARQLGQLHFVQSIQSVEATNCLCTNTAKSRDTCVSIRSIIALSWALQVIFKVRSVSVHSVNGCTWVASLLLFSLFSRNGPFIVRSTRLFYRPSGFTQLLNPSRGSTTNSDKCLFLFLFCISDVVSIQQLLCDPLAHLWWSVGSMANRISILQTCNVVVVLK